MALPENPFSSAGLRQGPVASQVAARPVDTYVAPARRDDAGQVASSLARALSEIQPSLRKYLAGQSSESETAAKARAAYLRSSAPLEELKAVQNDQIAAQESPLVRKFYMDGRGREAAELAAVQIMDQYREESANFDPADDNAFDSWVAGRQQELAQYAQQADPEFALSYLGEVEKTFTALRSQHRRDRHEALKQSQVDTFANRVGTTIEAAYAGAALAKTDVDIDAIWASINSAKNVMSFQQFDNGATAKIVRDQILAIAERRGNLDGYELLTKLAEKDWTDPKTGKPVPGPFKSAEGRTALEQGINRVYAAYYENENRAFQQEKRLREESERKTLGTLGEALSQGASLPPTVLADVSKTYGIEAASRLASFVSGQRNLRDYVDPAVQAEFYTELASGPIPADRLIRKWLPMASRDSRMAGIIFDDWKAGRVGADERDRQQSRALQVPGYNEWQRAAAPEIENFGGLLGDLSNAPGYAVARARASYAEAFALATRRLADRLDSDDFDTRLKAGEQLSKEMSEVVRKLSQQINLAGQQVDPAAQAASISGGRELVPPPFPTSPGAPPPFPPSPE